MLYAIREFINLNTKPAVFFLEFVAMGTNFLATATAPCWTDKMHQKQGNVLLADGSVQQLSSSRLRDQLRNTGDTTTTTGVNTLMFP